MSFGTPIVLWGLLVIPLAVVLYALAQRRRMRYAVRFTNLDLLANVVTKTPRWRRHLPMVLFLLALSSLLVGLARPQAHRAGAQGRSERGSRRGYVGLDGGHRRRA
jgi:Ca-activated chloride channel homolog